jgi:hypothetical protein
MATCSSSRMVAAVLLKHVSQAYAFAPVVHHQNSFHSKFK